MKRPALQNKQVVVLRMAFRARKVLGTFEKRAPGAHPFIWTLVLIHMQKKTNFHMKGLALKTVLKVIRKWPIAVI